MMAGVAKGAAGTQSAKNDPVYPDPDPEGGYTLKPPKKFHFFDYRHIDPRDLRWYSPEGRQLPVAGPPDPPVDAWAGAQDVADGIRLVAQKATKEGPIEGLPNIMLYDDGKYQAWTMNVDYGSGKNLGSYTQAPAKSMLIRHGESTDGYAWNWRKVGTVKTPPGISGIDGGYFFIDPHGPAEERYKCIYHALVLEGREKIWREYQKLHPRYRDTRFNENLINGLYGLVSPDGENWKVIQEPLMIHKGDTDNTVYYDEFLGKYVLYTRLYWMGRRMVARAESDDFRHWTPVEPMLWPRLEDPFSWDVYTNARTCYPGRPDHHLMFPIFYRRLTQTSESHMHSSYDGIHWDRVPGGPVLEPGDPGSWDGEYIIPGKGLVPLGADRVAIPYSAYDYPHKYPRWPGVISHKVGWASWQRGRMCALRADGYGQFDTFKVEVTGRELRLNCKVPLSGAIRVGLYRTKDRSVEECDAISGDHTSHLVTWKGDPRLTKEPGEKVILRFRMRAAELFSFEFKG